MPREYVIKSNGQTYRRPVELTVEGEQEVDIGPAIMSNLVVSVARKIRNLYNSSSGKISLSVLDEAGSSYVSLELSKINFLVPIKCQPDGIVTPAWTGSDAVRLLWTIPNDMRLFLTAYICANGTTWQSDGKAVYLFALRGKEAFKLPVGNLFADCRVCTGNERGASGDGYKAATLLDCMADIAQGFENSLWNSDLIHSSSRELQYSEALFRFQTTNEGFKQLPSSNYWWRICTPFVSDILKHLPV